MAKRLKEVQVAVSVEAHARAKDLADRLSAKIHRPVTLREIFDRATECLSDAQKGSAWLNPREAWAAMQERVEMSMAAVVVAVIHKYEPGARVRMGFDNVREELSIEVDGEPFVVKSVDKESAMDAVRN